MEENKNILQKKRAPNFCESEVRILIKLVLENKNVIENKKTDSGVWKLKEQTWQCIADTFNAISGTFHRSPEMLRSKYEMLKKSLKKKIQKNKQETFKTGGGEPEYIPIEGPEKDLLVLLNTQINGLHNVVDSDSVLPPTDVTGEILVNKTNFQITEPCTSASIKYQETELTNHNEKFTVGEDTFEHLVSNQNTSICSDTNIETENIVIEVISDEENTYEKSRDSKVSETNKWNTWCPNLLKTKKHPALKKHTKSKTQPKLFLNNKINHVIDNRQKLIQLQIENLIKEDERKRIEHEKTLEKIEIEKNILLIKEKILKEELKLKMIN